MDISLLALLLLISTGYVEDSDMVFVVLISIIEHYAESRHVSIIAEFVYWGCQLPWLFDTAFSSTVLLPLVHHTYRYRHTHTQ
jgi:hypothetical protein